MCIFILLQVAKKYVGITKQNPKRRWKGQGQGYKGNKHFTKAIQKYGWDNFKHEIIFYGLSQKEAEQKENDNNIVINIYPSVLDASKELNVNVSGLYKAIRRKTKSHNYYWKYKEE